MKGKTHRKVTAKAFRVMLELCPGIELSMAELSETAKANSDTDNEQDVKFLAPSVDLDQVDNLLFGSPLDVEAGNDILGKNTTGFNHFIDIRKAALEHQSHGVVDDYDGLSYGRGSASVGEYEPLSNACYSYGLGKDAAEKLGWKTDEAFARYLKLGPSRVLAPPDSDESPAMERYAYHSKDSGSSLSDEMQTRFACNIADAIFMPLDNLGRYWYEEFVPTGNCAYLGRTLHAVQDAAVPHHASGCNGNWHADWELQQQMNIGFWCNFDLEFEKAVRGNVLSWYRFDDNPPERLGLEDYKLTPAANWRVDHLITWVALNAYRSYAEDFNHFQDGFAAHPTMLFQKQRQLKAAYEEQLGGWLADLLDLDDEARAAAWRAVRAEGAERERRIKANLAIRSMSRISASMSVLLLIKANQEYVSQKLGQPCTKETLMAFRKSVADNQSFEHYVANRRSKELHRSSCTWAEKILAKNALNVLYPDELLSHGFNGCYYCMPESDKPGA